MLVTDNGVFNRRLLSRMLTQMGCQVEMSQMTEHGAQAVELVQNQLFDALIMDISASLIFPLQTLNNHHICCHTLSR